MRLKRERRRRRTAAPHALVTADVALAVTCGVLSPVATASDVPCPARGQLPRCARRPGHPGHRRLRSGATLCEGLPWILVHYDTPADLYNRAPTDEDFRFRVDTVQRVSLVQQRRALWQEASVVKEQAGEPRTVTVHHPSLADTDGHVGLRVETSDGAGNRTVQTADRADALNS